VKVSSEFEFVLQQIVGHFMQNQPNAGKNVVMIMTVACTLWSYLFCALYWSHCDV